MAPRPNTFQRGDTGRADSRDTPEEETEERGKPLGEETEATRGGRRTVRGQTVSHRFAPDYAPLTLRSAGSPPTYLEKKIGPTPART